MNSSWILQALNLVPGRQLDLQDFVGLEASGHQDSIHKLTMARMGSGDASISVQSQNEPNFVVKGRISDIKIPRECRPRFSRNDLEMMPGFLNDLGGFQLLDLITTELKSHMTFYNSMPLIGWNYTMQTGEQSL